MLIIFEILFVLWLAWRAFTISRQPVAHNVSKGAIAILALLSAYYITIGFHWALPQKALGLGNLLLLSLVVFGGSYGSISFLLRYFLKRLKKEPNTSRKFSLGSSLIASGLIALAVLALSLGVPLAHTHPEVQSRIDNDSLYLHLFVTSTVEQRTTISEQPLPASDEEQTQDWQSLQAQFLKNLKKGAQSTRGFIGEKAGTEALKNEFRAFHFLLSLDKEETSTLVEAFPVIDSILSEPEMHMLLSDPAVSGHIERISAGEWQAIYSLSNEPTLQALSQNKSLHAQVSSLNILEMENYIREQRIQKGTFTPQQIHFKKIPSFFQLRVSAEEEAGWSEAHSHEDLATPFAQETEGYALISLSLDLEPPSAKRFFSTQSLNEARLFTSTFTPIPPKELINDETIWLLPAGERKLYLVFPLNRELRPLSYRLWNEH